jgi:aspartyl protease family protein
MLRSSILVAVVACVLAAYAPTVLPALFAAMDGGAPQPLTPAPPVAGSPPLLPASASDSPEDRRVVQIAADGGGQYSTDVTINGVLVHMLVDSGATTVAISAETAERIGLPLNEASYTAIVRTANGAARAAPVVLSAVTVGDIYVPAVQGVVFERRAGRVDLLGMSFLKRLSSVEQKAGRLILRQ